MQRLRGQKAEHIAFVCVSDVYIYFTSAADRLNKLLQLVMQHETRQAPLVAP